MADKGIGNAQGSIENEEQEDEQEKIYIEKLLHACVMIKSYSTSAE